AQQGPPHRWSVRSMIPASGLEGPNAVSHIELTGDEAALLVANRGPDTLSLLSLDALRPLLVAETAVGAHPRHFTQLGDLVLVAAQEGGSHRRAAAPGRGALPRRRADPRPLGGMPRRATLRDGSPLSSGRRIDSRTPCRARMASCPVPAPDSSGRKSMTSARPRIAHAPAAPPASVAADRATAQLSAAPDRTVAAARAAQLFEESSGDAPAAVWSAPGRVTIIGEHVDYQDGLCLPMAISHRCFAAAARTPTNRLRLRSAQDETVLDIDARTLTPEAVTGWPAYVAGVLWALRPHISGASTRGMDIMIDGQVPLGAGLSSSAALECAAAEAIEDLLSLGTGPLDRVRAAITAETDFAGASTGGLDQSASVLSREGHALFLDCRDFSTRPVPWDLASQG